MTRNVMLQAWKNFLKSFRVTPDRYFGELKGEDYLGNKYFEIGPDPQGGRSRASRWFESKNPDDYLQEIPSEWMAWLRRQRNDPPTQEEIIRNMAMARMKKENAAKIKKEFSSKSEECSSKSTNESESKYPQYPEYERAPGEKWRF